MSEPIWLDAETLIRMHAEQLERFGGPPGIRDKGLLESACGRPLNRWLYGERDLAALSASYAFGLARNHPFIDGNKRIAFLAMATFLLINDAPFDCDPLQAAEVILRLAAGELEEAALADWIRTHIAAPRG